MNRFTDEFLRPGLLRLDRFARGGCNLSSKRTRQTLLLSIDPTLRLTFHYFTFSEIT